MCITSSARKVFLLGVIFFIFLPAAPAGEDDQETKQPNLEAMYMLLHGANAKLDASQDDEILADDQDDDLLSDDYDADKDLNKDKTVPAEERAEDRGLDYHDKILRENRFPSADTCKTCHPTHYDQWSVSPHSYAQMSPVANAMNGKMQILTQGTIGDFCMRCHSPISMALNEPIFMSNMDRHPASREGITCVACHRVSTTYGKVVGRIALDEGNITTPIYGPTGNENLSKVLEDPDFRVVTDPDEKGRKIHGKAEKFGFLTKPSFCGGCHEVILANGTRLEETFTEYKHSPAAAAGVTCQDCHMGTVAGKASKRPHGPAANVGGVDTAPRPLSNHLMPGPDYSLLHPGIYPHNADAAEMATIREWLTFDWKAGWGTDAFEDKVSDDFEFPPRWVSIDDRYDARQILKRQFRLLDTAAEQRRELLKGAYLLGDIEVKKANRRGLAFDVEVKSGTDGHNAPSGFERMVFLQVKVTDATGQVVFKSGDLDPNGDVRDWHSEYVKNNKMPYDKYLFNMQSKFVTRNVRGTEREQVLGANVSVSALPFVRPDTRGNIVMGRPIGQRLLKRGIEPNGRRIAKYEVKKSELTGNGPYKANVKIIAGMIPVNLIDEVKDAGIDYYMTPRELAERNVAGFQVLHERDITLTKGNRSVASTDTPAAPTEAK